MDALKQVVSGYTKYFDSEIIFAKGKTRFSSATEFIAGMTRSPSHRQTYPHLREEESHGTQARGRVRERNGSLSCSPRQPTSQTATAPGSDSTASSAEM